MSYVRNCSSIIPHCFCTTARFHWERMLRYIPPVGWNNTRVNRHSIDHMWRWMDNRRGKRRCIWNRRWYLIERPSSSVIIRNLGQWWRMLLFIRRNHAEWSDDFLILTILISQDNPCPTWQWSDSSVSLEAEFHRDTWRLQWIDNTRIRDRRPSSRGKKMRRDNEYRGGNDHHLKEYSIIFEYDFECLIEGNIDHQRKWDLKKMYVCSGMKRTATIAWGRKISLNCSATIGKVSFRYERYLSH